jgi:hypothetical protein
MQRLEDVSLEIGEYQRPVDRHGSAAIDGLS